MTAASATEGTGRMQGAEFLEYLELQGNLNMVTKSELLDLVRSKGGHISHRQLTTYISEGLIPESARIGSRSGAYPEIIADLLAWVSDARSRGLSLRSIKELIPVWRFLIEACNKRELSLVEFEYRARQHVTSSEAAFHVPFLLLRCLPCPRCLAEHKVDSITIIPKDGEAVELNGDEPVTIDFVMAQRDDDTGDVRRVAHLPLPLTMPKEDPRFRVALGISNGVELPAPEHVSTVSAHGEPGRAGPDSKEV